MNPLKSIKFNLPKRLLALIFAICASCGAEIIQERSGSTGNVDSEDAIPTGETVSMYEFYAMAYFKDGSLGPRAGAMDYKVLSSPKTITMDFWHGHNGVMHTYTLTLEHLAKIKAGEKIELETSIVDGHSHKLFIDSSDERWRVENATLKKIPLYE